MKFKEWRADAKRIAAFRVVLEMPIVQEALACMEAEAPVHASLPTDITPHFAHIHVGRARGYAEYAHTLPLLGQHPVDHSAVQRTATETTEEEE